MNLEDIITVSSKRIFLKYKLPVIFMIFLSIYVQAQPFQITSARYSAQEVNVGCSIISTPDSSLFIAGYMKNSFHNKDIYVLRLTKELDTVWTKKINCDYLNADPTILHIPSNRLLVLGNYGCKGLLIMMDENGKTLWQKKIEYKNRCVSIFNGLVLKDKGFVLVGATYGSVENRKAFITFTDTVGVTIWSKEFDLGEISNAKAISFNGSDKNSVVVGCTNNSKSYLLNIDLNSGNLRWKKPIENNWILNSICVTPENNFLLVGDAEGSIQPDRASWNEGIIFKVDSKGEVLWTKKNNLGRENSFSSITRVNNYKYIICGYKWIDMGIYGFTITTYYNPSDSIDSYSYSDGLFSIANDICIYSYDEFFMTGSTFRYPTDEERSDLYVVRFKLLSDH